jgi:hypothetical protein
MDRIAAERRSAHPPLSETPAFLLAIGVCAFCAVYWLLMTKVYYFTSAQTAEIAVYLICAIAIPSTALYLYATRRSRRERRKIHPPLVMGAARDRRIVQKAWEESAVVLGYDIHGQPWLWPDEVRVKISRTWAEQSAESSARSDNRSRFLCSAITMWTESWRPRSWCTLFSERAGT